MIYTAKKGQVSYGEAIGIILIENYAPFIPGDVANATTYNFPVRFQRLNGFTPERTFANDLTFLDPVIEAAQKLVKEGVRAITSDCGYMALFQREVANELEVPVFLSSLLQVPLISSMLGRGDVVGIMCANSEALNAELLAKVGIDSSIPICIKGLQNAKNFRDAILKEVSPLDSDKIEEELVCSAKEMTREEPGVKAILLECSCFPPYGAAVQEATGLPVFDFVTFINYVYLAVVKRRFQGFM